MLSSTYIDSCSADHRPDETSLLGIQLLLSLATTFAATIRLTMRRADPRLPVEVSLCAHQSQAGSRLRSGRTCGRVPAPPPIAHGIALNSPNAALGDRPHASHRDRRLRHTQKRAGVLMLVAGERPRRPASLLHPPYFF